MKIRVLLCLLILMPSATGFVSASRPELIIQTGHTGGITSLSFTPDGARIASGSLDSTVKIWDTAAGRELRTLRSCPDPVNSLSFSPDGKVIAGGCIDMTVRLWNALTGEEMRSLKGHTAIISSVAFSPGGSLLASGGRDNCVRIWDPAKGREIRILKGFPSAVLSVSFNAGGTRLAAGYPGGIRVFDPASGRETYSIPIPSGITVDAVSFSKDGRYLAAGSSDRCIHLYHAASGKEYRVLKGHRDSVTSASFHPSSGKLASGSADGTVIIWDIPSGSALLTLKGHKEEVKAVAFNPCDGSLASGSIDSTLRLWDSSTGAEIMTLTGFTRPALALAFSPGGKVFASRCTHSIKLWDLTVSNTIRTIRSPDASFSSMSFSADGNLLAAGRSDSTIKIYDLSTGLEKSSIPAECGSIVCLSFSADGRMLAGGSADGRVRTWELSGSGKIRDFKGMKYGTCHVFFSSDGTMLTGVDFEKAITWNASTGKEIFTMHSAREDYSCAVDPSAARGAIGKIDSGNIDIWNLKTGNKVQTLTGDHNAGVSLLFSPDGKFLAGGSTDNSISIWDIASARQVRTLEGRSDNVTPLAFSPDGRTLASGSNRIKLWNVETGKAIAELVPLSRNDWAVVTSTGRFDASPAGMGYLHWVAGNEPVELSQLKARYYEPGLLSKLMGYNPEPLRSVKPFDDVHPVPSVKARSSAGRTLTIELADRGGGIGRVQVFVNDKEFCADARGGGGQGRTLHQNVQVDLSGAPFLPGKENNVRIVAWNGDDSISGRGHTVAVRDRGSAKQNIPRLWALVAGISKYDQENLRLRFASKDASDFAKALKIGATRLFGPDNVHITLINTEDSPGSITPTKDNIVRTFQQMQKSKPGDILVIYLAGHGVSLKQGSDLYCYLTSNARSADLSVMEDPAVIKDTAITSEEMVEWIKKIPALKQVMILDTCEAGAAAAKLAEKRAISGDQIRAIDRLKDRTGFHILMGCASNAVSYEASKYGQGLLTYSLLQGMKGAALREDEFVDISVLFQFSADRVPELARDVGGIQRPLVAAPGGTSFDIGQLNMKDREDIPLEKVKPVILRPLLLNSEDGMDSLNLTAVLSRKLSQGNRGASKGSRVPSYVYVDAQEFPGAFRPSGLYSADGDRVKVTIVLVQDQKKIARFEIDGLSSDPSALAEKIADVIIKAAEKL